MKPIPKQGHYFGWLAFIKVTLTLSPFMGFVALKIAHNFPIAIKYKIHF